MRLTDHVSTLLSVAIANQANVGEVIDHEAVMAMVSIPGGQRPQITLIIVGYDALDQPVVAPAVLIAGPVTTQVAIDAHVVTALTWIRAHR